MDFVKIASFNNKLQAETVAHLLDEADIPYQIHSDEALFGTGGVTPYVFLSVPREHEAAARKQIETASSDD